VMHTLASALGDLDREAARLLREEQVAALERVRGPEHSSTLAAKHNLAILLMEADPERPAKLFEQVLAISSAIGRTTLLRSS